MVASVASSRSTASVVPSPSRNRGRRHRQEIQTDIGRARSGGPATGAGSSWKLSGGSMWSAAVTKVSKNRQVRRAISRSAWASAADTDIRPAIARRPAGPARDRRRGDPQRRERHRQGPRAMPGQQGDRQRQHAEDRPRRPSRDRSRGGRAGGRSPPAPPEPIRADAGG